MPAADRERGAGAAAGDDRGSIRVVFDQAGAVAARSDYLPFGEAWAPSGNLPSQRFTGQQRDADEGFDYFSARSYRPTTGRFHTVDPVFAGLFQPQGWNRYTYVRNNPVLFTDPSGLNLAACTQSGYINELGQIVWTPDRNCSGGSSDGGGGGGGGWGSFLRAVWESAFGTVYAPTTDQIGRGSGRQPGQPNDNTAAARYGEPDGNASDPTPAMAAAIAFTAAGTPPLVGSGMALAKTPANLPPTRVARVIAGEGPFSTLGRRGETDVFVTAADDIAGLNASQLSNRLGIDRSDVFTVIEFPTPGSGLAARG